MPLEFKDFNQILYRIRLIAGREKLLHGEDFKIDYGLIKTLITYAPASLEVLIESLRYFPWLEVIKTDTMQDLNYYVSLKKMFIQSTDYFVYAIRTYISKNTNNFTIDHDTISCFWFNQDSDVCINSRVYL